MILIKCMLWFIWDAKYACNGHMAITSISMESKIFYMLYRLLKSHLVTYNLSAHTSQAYWGSYRKKFTGKIMMDLMDHLRTIKILP